MYLEGGARPHVIKNRTRGRNRRKALALQGGGFASAVNHPGTKGKKTWSRGLKAGEQPAMRVFKLTHQRSLLESFR